MQSLIRQNIVDISIIVLVRLGYQFSILKY